LAEANALQSLETFNLSEMSINHSWLVLPSLKVLELDGKYRLPDMSNIPDLDLTRQTPFQTIELYLGDEDFGIARSWNNDDFTLLLKSCPKLKDLRLYLNRDLWSTRLLR
jgi:hypothetical protein